MKKHDDDKLFRYLQLGMAFIAAMVALAGYFLSAHASYQQREDESIRETINRKIEWVQKIDSAVTNMRYTRYVVVLQCKFHRPLRLYDQSLRRFDALNKVVTATAGVSYIFNEKVKDNIVELNHFDESVKDVCAPGAPDDQEWYKRAYEINKLMGESIQQDKEKLID